MAEEEHAVHVRHEKGKCNLFKLQADFEKLAKVKVKDRERHAKEPNTEVFWLHSAEDVEKVLRLREKLEAKYRVTLRLAEPRLVRQSGRRRKSEDRGSFPSSPEPYSAGKDWVSEDDLYDDYTPAPSSDSPASSPASKRASPAAAVVPTREVVPLKPWELKLLRLGTLDQLCQSFPGVEFAGDAETQGMYLLGPSSSVSSFKAKILEFLKNLQSREWECSRDLATMLGTVPAVVNHVEREFEQKKVHAVLRIEKVQSSETSYKVTVWGRSPKDLDAAILEMDTTLTVKKLKLTPELEVKLTDHADDVSAYCSMMEAQGLMQITVQPRSKTVHVFGVKLEVEWWLSKLGKQPSPDHDSNNTYEAMQFADELEENLCPDLPSSCRRLLYRHMQYLRQMLEGIEVDQVFEEGTWNPYLHLYGSKEECLRGQERLRELAARVREDEFVLPDLAIISFLDRPEGTQLLTELENKLHVIIDVNNNRTFPDSYYSSVHQGDTPRERGVERVVNEDGSYVFQLKNEEADDKRRIYEEVEDFFQLGNEGVYENPGDEQDTEEWLEQGRPVELPKTEKAQPVGQKRRPEESEDRAVRVGHDGYVNPSTLDALSRAWQFQVQEGREEGRVQLQDGRKMLCVLIEHAELSTLSSGADAVVNFVTDVAKGLGCISSLVKKEQREAIQQELKSSGQTLMSKGVMEGACTGDLGCGAMLHVLVKAGPQKVKDAISRALTSSDEGGQRVLVIPTQGFLDAGEAEQVEQACEAIQEFSRKLPQSLTEIKLVCADDGAVDRFCAGLASKEGGEEEYSGVHYADDKGKVTDVTELDWDNSELTGLCNKEMRSVYLRVTYLDPLTLSEVAQRLKDKFYTRILALSLEHQSIRNLYHYQCTEVFKTAKENVVVVVQKQEGAIRFLGPVDEAAEASKACVPVLKEAKDDYFQALKVEWCFLDHQDVVRCPSMEENCRWERSWRRDCPRKRPHFKVSVDGQKHLVELDTLRLLPFKDPDAWMPLFRVDKSLPLPQEWTGSENLVELLSVGSEDHDYATIMSHLKGREVHGRKLSLIKIERVKNARLWRQYQAVRGQVAPRDKRRRFSLLPSRGPDFRLWCDVTSDQAKNIFILGLRPQINPGSLRGPAGQQTAPGRRGLRLFSTPRRACLHAFQQQQQQQEEEEGQRVLVQLEAVAVSLKKEDPKASSLPLSQDLTTCLVDSTTRPHEFLLPSHVLTYPRLFATYRLV